MAEVRIYTTPTCPYCIAALALLRRKRVPFDNVNVAGDTAKRAWLAEVTGRTTVPQVFIDGRPVGGYTDLEALDDAGELDRLLGLA